MLVESRTLQLVTWIDSGKNLLAEGLSEKAVSLISDVIRSGTVNHYELSWRKCLKSETYKVIMLLALTGSSRAHEICYQDIRYLIKYSSD